MGGFTAVELILATLTVAVLASAATTAWDMHRAKAQVHQAVTDIGRIQVAVASFALDEKRFPRALDELGPEFAALRDPWGHPYQYADRRGLYNPGETPATDVRTTQRSDDYDLFSLGRDGVSNTDDSRRDDIIRAAGGRFIGLASDYRP